MHVLRDYQVEAVSAIERALNSGLVNSALLTLPTGTGKTVVLSELAKNNVASRTLIVCPMRELIHQAAEKVQQITGVFPDIEMASLWSSEIGRRNPYIVASKQTLTMKQRDGSKRYQRLTDIGLLVLDEAHTVITGPTIEMIDWYRDRGAMVVGVTATPNRHDKKSLKNAFDVCPYSMTLPEAISLGWLVSPRSNVVRVKSMDLSHVKVQGGDFSATGLNAVVEEERVELEMADVIARESVGLKTAVYCSSVAQAEKLAEILSVRYGLRADFVCADEQKCSSEHRKEVLDSFKSEEPGAIQVVTNCGILCLDDKTEILTGSGWASIGQIDGDSLVANYYADGTVKFSKPLAVHERDRLPGERMVSMAGKRVNVRVTEGHSVVRLGGRGDRRVYKEPARDVVGKQFTFPVSGVSEPTWAWAGEARMSEKRRGRLIASRKWNLKNLNGMSEEESSIEASRRIDQKELESLAVQPQELTLDQCRFIGFWIGDGTKSGGRVSLTQSVVYPKIIKWVDRVLSRSGLHHTRSVYPAKPRQPGKAIINGSIRWSLASGLGGGDQYRSGGYAKLIPYLEKKGTDLLWSLSEPQFDAFIEGYWMADGDHGDGTPLSPRRSRIISSTSKTLLDLIQAVACCRGYLASLKISRRSNKNPRHADLWRISLKKTGRYYMGSDLYGIENAPWKPERVWCVSVDSGMIITRRNGKVAVLGNCTGWDFPGLEHIVMARPTKSLSLYTQILGRATRPLAGTVDFPGSTPELRRAAIADSRKPHFKMTDLVDISLSHRICTTIDALEGEMDEKLRDRFMEEVTDGGLVDVQQKMEELRRRMEDEERAEKAREAERVKRQQMLLEARRRQGIRANVQYDTVAVDVMNTPGIRQKSMVKRGPVALFGKYKGQPLAAIDSGYLKWKLTNITKMPEWYRTQIQNELVTRGGRR